MCSTIRDSDGRALYLMLLCFVCVLNNGFSSVDPQHLLSDMGRVSLNGGYSSDSLPKSSLQAAAFRDGGCRQSMERMFAPKAVRLVRCTNQEATHHVTFIQQHVHDSMSFTHSLYMMIRVVVISIICYIRLPLCVCVRTGLHSRLTYL